MSLPMHFPGQKAEETVKLVVRPHWLVMLPAILFFILAALVPIGILVAATAASLAPLEGTARVVVAISFPAYYLTLVTWFFVHWIDYYLDVGIVTNERVIDIDQNGLFRRNVAELDCKMVQDIESEKDGVLQTMFDFGKVTIQTAGETPEFSFKAVPHPAQMVQRIREAVDSQSEASNPVEKVAQAAEQMKEAADEINQQQKTDQPGEATPPPPPDQPAQAAAPTEPKPTEPPTQDGGLPQEYEN